jgi:uncharacterized protein YdhG (YjbR/CyaY superfamily)
MVQSAAPTVEEYLAELPAERREAVARVREVVNENLPKGYEEGMQYGMIGWYIPLQRYPETYNGEPLGIVALAAQKRHYSLYLHSIYADPAERRWFERAYADSGHKLDAGKSCVRFRRLEDLPLDVIAEAVSRTSVDDYIERYEASRRR